MTELLDAPTVSADQVHEVLRRSILADGMDLVLDLTASRGSRLVDQRKGDSYLDMFTFFASNALGMNHPGLADDADFVARIGAVAVNKPSNSDIYSVPMARFVDTFARVLGDERLPHRFFVEGGGLAVENALKVAFDWKSRLNESKGLDPALGTKVMHLTGAFHGRTGYTMSLTNTDPNKVARFPKFDWPRIEAPFVTSDLDDTARREEATLAEARRIFAEQADDIACFICEPIQGEGGDRHLRAEFLQAMQALCHENDALFILDEVQTGGGLTGSAWAYQQLGVEPDVVSFGKKLQVCGIMAGGRVDEVEKNVFEVGSRINSTWGGNLTDMVRATRILEVMESDQLVERAAALGAHLLDRLQQLADKHDVVTEPRGRGLMCAISLPDAEMRDTVIAELWKRKVIMLGCGVDSLRFRPALTVTAAELDEAVDALDQVLTEVAAGR